MPRRYRPLRREVDPDPKYNNEQIAHFINRMMWSGKKSTAQGVLYGAFEIMEAKAKRNPVEIFEDAVRNATPQIEVKPRRVGGATYQVPVEIRADRRTALAHRWLIQNARKRNGKSMTEKLAAELLDAANNQGATIRKRDETHKMAEANRAFAHYRY